MSAREARRRRRWSWRSERRLDHDPLDQARHATRSSARHGGRRSSRTACCAPTSASRRSANEIVGISIWDSLESRERYRLSEVEAERREAMAPFVESESSGLYVGRELKIPKASAYDAELLADELGDDARVRLPAGLLHHLADEEAEQALLAARGTPRPGRGSPRGSGRRSARARPSSDTASCARYGSAEKPGSPSFAIASSKAARGIRSRASTSFASSCAGTAAGIDARADEGVRDDVRRRDRAPRRRRPSPPTAGRARRSRAPSRGRGRARASRRRMRAAGSSGSSERRRSTSSAGGSTGTRSGSGK